MVELGVSIVAVKEILSHSSLEMTLRYSHPHESIRTALEGLSTLFSETISKNVLKMNRVLREQT